MIVIDLSQTLYSTILGVKYDVPADEISLSMFRHICLNAIRNIINKFKVKYGDEIVIACDGKGNWRKKEFEYYKASRQKSRNESNLNWTQIFEKFDSFKSELKNNFLHYKVIEVDSAEADDIIYCCAKYCVEKNKPLCIVSGDKDLVQLQRYKNIIQYDAVHKKIKTVDSPVDFLYYQIFKGDAVDGIPNVLSPTNSYVIGKRCTPLRESKIKQWLDNPLFDKDPKIVLGDEIYERYKLNKLLIDLSEIPNNIIDSINEILHTPFNTRDNNLLMNYFIDNRLTTLIKNIQDF